MPLYDFKCQDCTHEFESLTSSNGSTEDCVCAKCGSKKLARQFAKVRIGGKGDLRESSSFDGCHPAGKTGHKHGPGCKH